MLVFVGVGTGNGIGIEIAVDGHFDDDADSDPETDSSPGISLYQPCLRNGEPCRDAAPSRLRKEVFPNPQPLSGDQEQPLVSPQFGHL